MSSNVGDGVPDAVDGLYDVYSVSFWLKVLLNGSLVAIITFLLMKIFMKRNEPEVEEQDDVTLPKMKKRDFTIQELREFDGTKGDGRILVAINGKVFDVTKGKHFYGPGMIIHILYGLKPSSLVMDNEILISQVVFTQHLVDMMLLVV